MCVPKRYPASARLKAGHPTITRAYHVSLGAGSVSEPKTSKRVSGADSRRRFSTGVSARTLAVLILPPIPLGCAADNARSPATDHACVGAWPDRDGNRSADLGAIAPKWPVEVPIRFAGPTLLTRGSISHSRVLPSTTDCDFFVDTGGEFGIRFQEFDAPPRRVLTVRRSDRCPRSADGESMVMLGDAVLTSVPTRPIGNAGSPYLVPTLGTLAMRAFGCIVFDWPEARLLGYPSAGSDSATAVNLERQRPLNRTWIDVPLVPMPRIRRVDSPPLSGIAEARAWLAAEGFTMDEGHLERTASAGRPFILHFGRSLNTPLPLVEVRLGDRQLTALIDTGYTGDLLIQGEPMQDGDALKEYRSWDGPRVVGGALHSEPMHIGEMRFDHVRVERLAHPRDTTSFGYDAILGLGILRRQPVRLDFDQHSIGFAVPE